MNKIELPSRPKLEDFPGDEYGDSQQTYQLALAAWERVCQGIIEIDSLKAFHEVKS